MESNNSDHQRKTKIDLPTCQKMIDNIGDALIIVQDGLIKYANLQAIDQFGCHYAEEVIGKELQLFIHPDDFTKVRLNQAKRIAGGQLEPFYEVRIISQNGNIVQLEIRENVMYWEGRPATLSILADVTERRRREAQLFQSQKMEAIGALAGSMAHAFSHILKGIEEYVSVLLLNRNSNEPDIDKLNKMQLLVQKGTDLTADLRNFCHEGSCEMNRTDFNQLVARIVDKFYWTNKNIIFHLQCEKDLWPVAVDQMQMEQVLIDLCVSALPAIPGSVRHVYLVTENITLSSAVAEPLKVKPGNYIRMTMTDTAGSMDEEACRRVFEPVFPAPGKDQAGGINLAAAYGIIRQHGGVIDAVSALAEGTVFTIYLPVSSPSECQKTADQQTGNSGNETILLVDDEASIIELCSEMLTSLGYKVLQADNGEDALKIYGQRGGSIDLVILDMMMPGLSGAETFDALKSVNPEVKVVLSTGYSISDEADKIKDKGCAALIQKPFYIQDLSRKIREVLDNN